MPKILPGSPYPQGATWDGTGVNFAIYSENATRVDLCLFQELGSPEHDTIEMPATSGYVWHCYVPGLTIGQLYGYRVHGPYEPERGLRFNPSKLLIDPYAKAIEGSIDYAAAHVLPYVPGDEDADLYADDEDDADAIPKCVVADESFDWEDVPPPDVSWSE